MKRVFFVRHAKSSWKDTSLSDLERPLNARGERDAPILGHWLANLLPQTIIYISSPALRARATAVQFCLAAGVKPDSILVNQSLYFEGPDAILDLVRHISEVYDSAVIFSHNPELTELANRFSPKRIANVPTCGIFELVHPGPSWSSFGDSQTRFDRFVYPKMLKHK